MKDTLTMGRRIEQGLAFVSVMLAIGLAGNLSAESITDRNSSININTSGSTAGMTSWLVDGVENAKLQWFWYQPISTGPQYRVGESSGFIGSTLTGNTLDLAYANDAYGAKITYTLTGGNFGSGYANLKETVVLTNLSSATMTLFDYSDFDLAGNTGGQSIRLTRGTGSRVELDQTIGSFWLTNSFVSGTKIPNHLEANTFGVAGSTLDRLTNQSGVALNDNLSVVSGDVTGAVQWNLAAGASITISKVLEIQVPEPSAVALLGLGLLAMWKRPKVRA